VKQLYFKRREVKKIKLKLRNILIRSRDKKGQSTLEYALVCVIAAIISAILIAVGKPMIIEIISKVFEKIASMI